MIYFRIINARDADDLVSACLETWTGDCEGTRKMAAEASCWIHVL
jgi:hypothetical protein